MTRRDWLGIVALMVVFSLVKDCTYAVVASASRPAVQADLPRSLGRMTTEASLPSPDFARLASGPNRYPVRSVAAAPLSVAATAPTVAGLATWFASPANVSAAGPALRRALGSGWRGTHVRVCSGNRCTVTVLGDWCACGPRGGVPTVIDLDDDVFRRLAPLSRGVIPVTVGTIPAPPATSTAP